jgi:hypothetical protein
MRQITALLVAAMLGCLGASANAANLHIYSYDPADPETRAAAGALTFEFNRRLVFTTVLRVLATEADAKAEVIPANERVLGPGGLTPLIGPHAIERDLYEIEPKEEGAAMIAALCPSSHRAWLAFGRLKVNHDLRIFVLGDNPATGSAKLCRTLAYSFHGEWAVPSDQKIDPGIVEPPQFPR